MFARFIKFIFFGNYFVGFLAIALSVESAFQLRIPLNSFIYYVLLFCATVFYYTYAYTGPLHIQNANNPRSIWYERNRNFIKWTQLILLVAGVMVMIIFFKNNFYNVFHLPLNCYVLMVLVLIAGLFYYGLLPKPLFKINLRKTGWLKAFVIGFVWACCANLLSFIAVQIEKGYYNIDYEFLGWLFIKNWMFCTVNAIMFDIKDYADDSNEELKTFVVSFGLRKTIFLILIPLMIIGLLSFIAFSIFRHLTFITFLFNLVPFILLLLLAFSMQKPHRILYYLIVIDGLVFLKALCGIAGSFFVK